MIGEDDVTLFDHRHGRIRRFDQRREAVMLCARLGVACRQLVALT